MQLDYAFLCDRVEVDADGKLNVYGVGVHVFRSTFPGPMPLLSLVVSLRLSQQESEQAHRMDVDFWSEHQLLVSGLLQTAMVPPRLSDDPFRDVLLEDCFQVGGVTLPARGEYELVIRVDDREVGRVPFRAWLAGEQA